jgi:serine/threonine protein kinase
MGYMAPEVIINTADVRRPYPDKCDLFSFGIIAHMILLGRNPLKGKSYEETYSKNKLCEINL